MKRNFNQLMALSSVSMAASLGVLGIGEAQDHLHRQDRQECYRNLAGKPELKDCLGEYDPDVQKQVQETYGYIFMGLGAISLLLGGKAYSVNRIQAREDQKLKEEYRKAEGLDLIH